MRVAVEQLADLLQRLALEDRVPADLPVPWPPPDGNTVGSPSGLPPSTMAGPTFSIHVILPSPRSLHANSKDRRPEVPTMT